MGGGEGMGGITGAAAVDEGGAEERRRGGTPAAGDIRVRWCRHDKRVSWAEHVLVWKFSRSEREEAGGDQTWVTRESDRLGRRRKTRTVVAGKQLGEEEEEGSSIGWSSSSLSPKEGDGGDTSSTQSCTSLESIGSSSWALDKEHTGSPPLNPGRSPFLASSTLDVKHKESSTKRPVNPFETLDANDNNSERSIFRPLNPFSSTHGDDSGEPSTIIMPDSSASSASSSIPNSGQKISIDSFSPGSLLFPVPSRTNGYDCWSFPSPPPEQGSGPLQKDAPRPTPTGENGEGEEPPSPSKPGFFASYLRVAGAMAVVGVAAAVGVGALRRRR